MFWWFERKGEFLSCESRQAPDGTFELLHRDAGR